MKNYLSYSLLGKVPIRKHLLNKFQTVLREIFCTNHFNSFKKAVEKNVQRHISQLTSDVLFFAVLLIL